MGKTAKPPERQAKMQRGGSMFSILFGEQRPAAAPASGKQSPRQPKAVKRSTSTDNLPLCNDSRIIIVVHVAEARAEVDPQDHVAFLPISVETALENTSAWLTEHMLRSLLHKVEHFARIKGLADPVPHYLCPLEQYSPLVMFLLAFVLVCLVFLSLMMSWGDSWILGIFGVVALGFGTFLYCICVHHREFLVGEDPASLCQHFAAHWSAKHGLPLTFHRRWTGPSYFELRKSLPRDGPPVAQESPEDSDDDDDGGDGWDMVRTPTAKTPRTPRKQ